VSRTAGFFSKAWRLVKQSFSEWSDDNAPRLGAALSYYTVFSLAPLLLLVISIAGLFWGREAAQGQVFGQIAGLIGRESAETVQTALAEIHKKQSGSIISTILGFVTLLVGATGVMMELQGALNVVWKVVPKPGNGVLRAIRQRLLSLGLILTFGFLLLVSLVLSAALHVLGEWMSGVMPGWVIVAHVINNVVAIGVVTLLFALLFKLLPDAKVAWRDVWIGALVTAVLFTIGKFGIGLYLGQATVSSTFGAAGSLAVLLVWVYYSSQILLLGAEFTRAYANSHGSLVVPDANAVPAPSDPHDRRVIEQALEKGRAEHPQGPPSRAKA
jgi:membrane protein